MLAQIDMGFKYCQVACEKHCIQREDDSCEDTVLCGVHIVLRNGDGTKRRRDEETKGRRNGQDRSLHLDNVLLIRQCNL